MRNGLIVCLTGVTALLAVPARAQEQPAEPSKPAVPPTEIKTDEGPIPDPNVPDDLLAGLPRDKTTAKPVHRYGKDDYPTEIVKRPLTLAGEQAQISLDMPLASNGGNPTLTQILRAAVGLTRDWQVGLTYSFGLERLSSVPNLKGYEAGKAFSVETAVTLLPQYLSAEISFAFLADPDLFGMSIAVGLPFKIEIGDRWAFFGGRNLVRFKVHGLAVDPTDPQFTFDQVALLDKGSSDSDGRVQIDVGVAYQPLSNVAVFGTFGVGWPDFSTNQQPYSLFAGASYTAARRWDFGGRIGFYRLDHLSDSFSVALFAAVRI